jgi:hypothetical protein
MMYRAHLPIMALAKSSNGTNAVAHITITASESPQLIWQQLGSPSHGPPTNTPSQSIDNPLNRNSADSPPLQVHVDGDSLTHELTVPKHVGGFSPVSPTSVPLEMVIPTHNRIRSQQPVSCDVSLHSSTNLISPSEHGDVKQGVNGTLIVPGITIRVFSITQYVPQYPQGPMPGFVGSTGVNTPETPLIPGHDGATTSQGIVTKTPAGYRG